MHHILVAALQKIIEADLIDLKKAKKRDDRVSKDRQRQNKEVLRRMKYQDQKGQEAEDYDEEEDYFDKEGNYSVEKAWKGKNIKNLKNLGEVLYVVEVDWSDYHDILQEFYEETVVRQDEIDEDQTVLDDMINQYKRDEPNWDFKDDLREVYENEGVDTLEHITFQFYQLPADDFGKANVGPSANMRDPDERDIEEAINRSFRDMLPKNYIVIYSDDKFKYKKFVNELKRERERLNP